MYLSRHFLCNYKLTYIYSYTYVFTIHICYMYYTYTSSLYIYFFKMQIEFYYTYHFVSYCFHIMLYYSTSRVNTCRSHIFGGCIVSHCVIGP